MKKLINAVDAVVREQLMGMAAAHPSSRCVSSPTSSPVPMLP